IEDLYGGIDERLIEFIATLAGAALENAAGVAQIQEALHARDEFLLVASHELRTPLTSLRLQVGSLGRPMERPPQRWDLARIAASVDGSERSMRRLARLIEQLLDISLITGGRVRLERELADLSALVSDVAGHLYDECVAAGSELSLELAEGVTGEWDH